MFITHRILKQYYLPTLFSLLETLRFFTLKRNLKDEDDLHCLLVVSRVLEFINRSLCNLVEMNRRE
jgi:hypothetical protein